ARHGGNVSHAASALGLSRSALYRRLQRYGL
ncbi:MAG: helix-turn-helix domain-containing protein, partial [Bryobacteraceae bacterium]